MKTIRFDLGDIQKNEIFNSLSTMCLWNPLFYDNKHVGDEPDGFIKKMYPWLEYFILMTFTGGKEGNNWYGETNSRNYDFKVPLEIIKNILRGGVKPFIVIGQTPNALSRNPEDFGCESTKWGNRYAPKSYEKYYEYIRVFAKMLVDNFGTDEIRTWKFRLMTEWDDCLDAQYWWKETPEEYFKLYDWTLAALSAEIGEKNLFYGPGNLKEISRAELILDHCAYGTNYFTGKIGTKCDHISVSQYYCPNVDVEQLLPTAMQMKRLTEKYKVLGIKEIGFGEGGFSLDCKENRLISAQGITEDYSSAAARMFHLCNINNTYFANWEYLTDRANIDLSLPQKPWLKTPAAKTAEFITKMLGGKCLAAQTDESELVNAVASIKSGGKLIYILVYNHSSEVGCDEDADVMICLKSLLNDCNCTVRLKRVDKDHGNFATVWLEESKEICRKNISFDMESSGNSKYDAAISLYLDDSGKAFYASNRSRYLKLSENVNADDFTFVKAEGTVTLKMPHHSVALLEIEKE